MKNLIIIIVFIFLGCKEKQQPKKEMTEDIKIYLDDKYNAIQKGNEESYKRLSLFYSNNPNYIYEFLSISIIMAEKYEVKSANFNVYYSLVKIYNNNKYTSYLFKNLNIQQREFAMYYLQRGVENKSIDCIVELARIYRYSIGYNKNIEKAESLEQIILKSNPNYDFKKADEFEMNIER